MAVSSYAFDDFGRNVDPFTGKIKEANHKHSYTTVGNIIQPFAFTGYQEDEVSGLKFAQARFYDANTGRFQSEDNVKGFIDSPFTMNHYGYCSWLWIF
ncbi:RHS repeat-associated core domain-containing protein [Butyrivibrio fibrisolvens]|uniref:RHS repeat-associated core domain-containing protein n=1 Tax=Pseudobutyrivibrio ruminis TaxID=46206 RepID=UPI0004092F5F|nr:RHS repeat-associated core domain-containing protein [Pseudobutyrivibrio ruminis]MDC7278409.1 RHS repeat-associated core domain-containing protein [Butyrivibrio fibrisolvens]